MSSVQPWLWPATTLCGAWLLAACGSLESYLADSKPPASSSPTDDPGGDPGEDPGDPGLDTGLSTSTSTDTTRTTDSTTSGTTDSTTTDTTSTTTPVVLQLSSITPSFGTNAGGREVLLTGSFDAATEAWFSGAQATVLSQTSTELRVSTPASAGTGWVDVEIRSGAQSVTLASGYQYWLDESGTTGTVGEISYIDQVGGYWSGGASDFAYGTFAFATGSTWELWQDYAPTLGSCAFDHASPSPGRLDTGASALQFSSAGASFVLPDATAQLGALWFGSDSLSVSNVVPNTIYDLDPVLGGIDWPGFGLPASVQIGAPFSVIGLDAAVAPITDRQIDLTWTGAGGDYMLIWILRQYQGVFGAWHNDGIVTCAVPDTGSTSIPALTWPDWFSNDFLHIQVGRVVTDAQLLPHNESTSNVAGVIWVYGGAYTVP